ncbi:YlqD family protein [Pectinatus cerevisiiphilus]|uniref:YlqD protein n=1 Tax=Pectinatus cerevisiiphilus TaxID=86956 RepID=A0A4R3K9M9_9FIRM|nr:YlqD family protein [Pectinatus cerevisiiphilus]TCS79361.1 YlqD protein [Pectinatus cerevisiiphilus]
MESITLQCPITVKAKVTEKFKTDMMHSLNRQIEKIDAEISRIEKDMKKVLTEQNTGDVQRVSMLLQRMEEEKQKRLSFKENLKNKITDTEELEIGAEIVQGTLQRLVEIKIGDTMPEIMNTELLVEDGKIIEMRD